MQYTKFNYICTLNKALWKNYLEDIEKKYSW
jgi:hypothetical protein